MISHRTTAIIVGVLFITATVTAILSIVPLGSVLESPDYLAKVSENVIQIWMDGRYNRFCLSVLWQALVTKL